MEEMNYTKFWVGTIPSIGEIIVYDPEMQLQENRNTYVYSEKIGAMVEKNTDFLKKKVVILNEAEQQKVVSDYRQWKVSFGAEFLQKERKEIHLLAAEFAREQRRKKPVAKDDSEAESEESYKVHHCNSCDQVIDSWGENRCPECGWIVCDCGACNC